MYVFFPVSPSNCWIAADQKSRAQYSSVNTADGPAMTWSIYAISEAQLQQKGCAAYTYLQRSSEPYIRKPFYQFSEAQLDSQPPGVENPAFIFGLNPAFPFLTGAGGFLQVLTHGLTGMRPNSEAFYLDPMLPPQLSGGIEVKGMKWQKASFDVLIGMGNTTITRRRTCSREKKHVTLEILGGNAGTKEYRLGEGESIVVPTRRPDISFSSQDLALCRSVVSDSEWVAGKYPFAVVDGSKSTAWQPATPHEASVIVDIGELQEVSKVLLFWGGVPPSEFRLSGRREANSDFEKLTPVKLVGISAPYDAHNARIVQVKEGNVTAVEFRNSVQLRFLRLTIAGSYATDGLGATVAEIQVINEGRGRNAYAMKAGYEISSFIGSLWRLFSSGGASRSN
jgi:hypothetical protein